MSNFLASVQSSISEVDAAAPHRHQPRLSDVLSDADLWLKIALEYEHPDAQMQRSKFTHLFPAIARRCRQASRTASTIPKECPSPDELEANQTRLNDPNRKPTWKPKPKTVLLKTKPR